MERQELIIASELKDALLFVHQQMQDPNNWDDRGMCSHVTDYLLHGRYVPTAYHHQCMMESLAKTWPQYSGNKGYPVPSPTTYFDAQEAYMHFRRDPVMMWFKEHSQYAVLRWSLLDYLIEKLNQMLNDNPEPEKENQMDNDQNKQLLLEHQIKVLQALSDGETIQYCFRSSDPNQPSNWFTANGTQWDWSMYYYRVKPKEITYDTMDWTNVDEMYQYASRDSNGQVYLYTSAPETGSYGWYQESTNRDSVNVPNFFTGHKPGNCDWKQSLIKRDGVEDWSQIDQLLQDGRPVAAIIKYRDHGGRDEMGYRIRSLSESKQAIEKRKAYLNL